MNADRLKFVTHAAEILNSVVHAEFAAREKVMDEPRQCKRRSVMAEDIQHLNDALNSLSKIDGMNFL